jgi:hypothetical protein
MQGKESEVSQKVSHQNLRARNPKWLRKKENGTGKEHTNPSPLSVFLTALPHFWSSTISKNIQPIQLSSLYIVITLLGNFGAKQGSN